MFRISDEARRRFQEVEVGDPPYGYTGSSNLGSTPIFYLARSREEYRRLGGELDPSAPELRSLRCVADKIDRETGVIDLTILLDLTNRRG